MFDRKSPLGALVDAELRKDGVLRELRTMALRMIPSRNEDEAKDLVAKSLLRVVGPKGDPWQPGGHTFLAHMHGVMKQLRYRQVRSLRRERVVADGDVAQENTAGDGPRPDDEVGRLRSLEVSRVLGDRVLARLVDDARARQLFEIAMKEDLDPSEQAARLGCTVDEVHAAAKRLRYHGRLVLKEWNAEEARRMRSLQEQATTTNEEGIP